MNRKILLFAVLGLLMFSIFASANWWRGEILPVEGPFPAYSTGESIESGFTSSMLRIPNSEYFVAVFARNISTYRAWNSNGTIQNKQIDVKNDFGPPQSGNVLVHISGDGGANGDIYALFNNSNKLATFRVWGTNGTIQQKYSGKALLSEKTATGTVGRRPWMIKVPGTNISVIATTNIQTYGINNVTGEISPQVSSILIHANTYDTTMCMVDEDTVLLVGDIDAAMRFQTYNVTATGSLTYTHEYDHVWWPRWYGGNVFSVDGSANLYAAAGWGSPGGVAYDLGSSTVRVWDNGTIQQADISNTVLVSNTRGSSTLSLGSNQYIMNYVDRAAGRSRAIWFNITAAGVAEAYFKYWDSGFGNDVAYDGWRGSADLGNGLYVYIAHDNAFRARLYTFWRNASAGLNVYTEGGVGTVTKNPLPPYRYGQTVTLTAITGSIFSPFHHWYGNITGNTNPESITLTWDYDPLGDWNKTVTANFSDYPVPSEVWLKVIIEGYGSVTQDPAPPYSYGDTVTLTPVPASMSTFHHWGGNLSGNGVPESLLMEWAYYPGSDWNKTIIANFSTKVLFTYTDNDTNVPDLLDVLNPETGTYDFARIFTYAWMWAMSGFFIAAVLGVIGGAIYVRYNKPEVAAGYFMVILVLYASVTQSIGYVFGVIVALIIGYLLYRVIKSTNVRNKD